MRPVICMITDRRRLGGGNPESALIERIGAAARAGIHLVQIRERDLDAGPLTHLVTRAVQATSGTKTRIVVNDRLDVALAAGAHGVHLRAESVPATRVRDIAARPFLIGRSVHSPGEVRDAASGDAADYAVFGTVFETGSKPGVTPAGLEQLASAAAATTLPLLAIGGVTVDRLGLLARAGASGFAAISLFADCSLEGLQVIVRQAALSFDTICPVP